MLHTLVCHGQAANPVDAATVAGLNAARAMQQLETDGYEILSTSMACQRWEEQGVYQGIILILYTKRGGMQR
jgi:hypothetical protein